MIGTTVKVVGVTRVGRLGNADLRRLSGSRNGHCEGEAKNVECESGGNEWLHVGEEKV